ncbi:isoprenylcysteine carboxyl methyltransferase family protein [Anaerobacillus sp. MEB173]|uniref:isoprenylcysteine carboxyl methyltransferase family protein n=1 Tax=Anaerobacillus sp. MEB173 TaxID=3383345 RepID=UPI003F911696
MVIVYLFIALVIVQRLVEVLIANRNAKWILSQGGYEVGRNHYRIMVFMHAFFFLALLIEVTLNQTGFLWWSIFPLSIFLITQFGRIWTLTSLGKYWNTRIMILPHAEVVKKGPYQLIRHPNYVIVAIEIAVLPLIFQAYWTAVIFSLLNAWVLSVRIKAEENALIKSTNYEDFFAERPRFLPTTQEK